MENLCFLLPIILSLIGGGLSARILSIAPFPGKSHQLYVTSILKALATRGHQIVEYSPFPPKTPVPNITHVEVHTRFEEILANWNYDTMKYVNEYDTSMFKVRRVWEMNYIVCEDTFKNENIQKLLKSNEKFDLILTESSFGEESLLFFGHKFKAPTIDMEPLFPWSAMNSDSGNSLSISSVPELMPFVATEQMSFVERFLNFIAVTSSLFFYYNSHIPSHTALLRQYEPDAPPVSQLINNVSLYFTNSHSTAVNYARPYTSNVVPIGGIHIAPDRLNLPQDVQRFMDGASGGVVYFSLGTMVPMHRLPIKIIQSFINAFKRIPQRILWKIDFDDLPPISDNVKIVKWVPQLGVLAHPNCAVFMTQGGLFSLQEAIHTGVPTVGIPFFLDQPYNIRYNEYRGIGVKLEFYSISEESIYTALTTVLNNPKYKENAQKLSRIYRDRPVSPAESAVYWVEYVLRHRGAPHLRPVSADLPFYQLYLLDVVAAVLISVVLFFTVVKKLLSLLCNQLRKKSHELKKNN